MTPQWHAEAEAAGIDYIVLVYCKAEGFAFCPRLPDTPFRVGGDYDGNWAVTAKGAIEYHERHFHQAYRKDVDWFMPFVQKVLGGEDFSLDDLKVEERGLRVIKGRWPW